MAKNGMTAKGEVIVTEIWKWLDWGADPSIASIDDMIKKNGMSWTQSCSSST